MTNVTDLTLIPHSNGSWIANNVTCILIFCRLFVLQQFIYILDDDAPIIFPHAAATSVDRRLLLDSCDRTNYGRNYDGIVNNRFTDDNNFTNNHRLFYNFYQNENIWTEKENFDSDAIGYSCPST